MSLEPRASSLERVVALFLARSSHFVARSWLFVRPIRLVDKV